MYLFNDPVGSFINNTIKLDYRDCVEQIDADLARNLIDRFGGDRDFQTAVPTVRSFGIEDVQGFDNSNELLYFFDENKEALLKEMALIRESILGEQSTAIDYIENNTDDEYTKCEIESALAESDADDYDSDNASDNRIAIAAWVCHQAASELCANYSEYIKKMESPS